MDLAKNVFQVHGVDEHGKTVLRRQLPRGKVLAFFARLEPCVVGMEACAGAHHWARALSKQGHDARLIAAQFVRPYRKNDKNDRNDAEAICEAAGRPNMRFVPIKTVEQQAVLSLHRVRQLRVAERTALVNQVRGLLAEYGIVAARGIARIRRELPAILEDAENGLPDLARELFAELARRLVDLDQIGEHDQRIDQLADQNVAAVALAAKHARIIWALLARDQEYRRAA